MDTLTLKQTVLVDGWDKFETQLHYNTFVALHNGDFDKYDELNSKYKAYQEALGEIWLTARHLNDARFKRVQRLRSTVHNAIKDGQAVFVTLTFTDAVLNSTNGKTRRTYVARFLKASSCEYVANKDIGSDDIYTDDNGEVRKGTEREHYHAIVGGRLNLSSWHQYGAIKVKKIRNTDKDIIRTSKYVAKLSLHAIKQSSSCDRIIYSRNTST